MGNLTNKYIKDTYDGLIKLQDSTAGVQPTLQPLQDGLGNDLPIKVSTTEVIITGSLQGTASHADSSDTSVSSSYALTASYAENVPSSSNIYVSGITFYSSSIIEPGGLPGELVLRRTEGEPDLVTDLDGRYQTIAQAAGEDLRITYLEYDVDALQAQTGSYLITGSVTGNVITMEKQDGTTFPLTVTVDPANLPAGVVSGSEQVILQDTTGNLSGSRISGPVNDSVSSSYAVSASYAENGGVTSIIAGTNVTIDQSTGNVTINASDAEIPVGGDQYQQLTTDGAGNLSWDFSTKTVINIKNVDSVPLTIGTPVYVVGLQGAGLYQVARADSSDPNKMPAIGLIQESSISVNGEGHAVMVGDIKGYNTLGAGWALNDNIYVSNLGILSNTRPIGTELIQKIGNVGSVANNGDIVVVGAGRSNDLPNIPTDHLWVGDINGVPQAVESTGYLSSSFAVLNGDNYFNGVENINGQINIQAVDTNAPLNLNSGSAAISFTFGEYGGNTQPALFFAGDNSYFQATDNFTIENSPGGQGTGNMDFRTNGQFGITTYGTGSQNITLQSTTGQILLNSPTNVTGNLNVTGTTYIKGASNNSTIIDVTGTTKFKGNIFQTSAVNSKSNTAYPGIYQISNAPTIVSMDTDFGGLFMVQNSTTGDELTLVGDQAQWGTGWSGPAIAGNDPSFNWPAFIGFQGKSTWTDGRVTFLTPIQANTSVELQSSLDVTGTTNLYGGLNVTGTTYIKGATNNTTVLDVTGTTNFKGNIFQTSAVNGKTNTSYPGLLEIRSAPYSVAMYTDFGGLFSVNNTTTGDEITLVGDQGQWGTGWSGPAIAGNDPAGNWPAFIGFQNKTTWTDGRVTIITPLVANTSVEFQGSLNVTGVTTTQNNIEVTGSVNILNGGINTATNTNNSIGGNTTFDGGGQLNVNGRFETTGETLLSNGFVASGSAQLTGSLSVSGATYIKGAQTYSTVLDVTGQTKFKGNITQTSYVAGNTKSNTAYPGTYSISDGANYAVSMYTDFGGLISINNTTTNDEITLVGDQAQWGSGWSGPAIAGNDPGNNWPAFIGFQNVSNWTDGRVTVVTPLVANSGLDVTGSLNVEGGGVGLNTAANTTNNIAGSTTFDGGGQVYVNGRFETTGETLLSNGAVITGSVNMANTMTLAPQNPLPTGGLGELAVSSSNELYFHNGTSWNVIV